MAGLSCSPVRHSRSSDRGNCLIDSAVIWIGPYPYETVLSLETLTSSVLDGFDLDK